MGFPDKPMASASKEKIRESWLVTTLNVGGHSKQERYFHSEAEADAYLLQQYALVRAEN